MLIPPAHFTPEQLSQFANMINECKAHFGEIRLPEGAPSNTNNRLVVAGKTLAALCETLNELLRECLPYTYESQQVFLNAAQITRHLIGIASPEQLQQSFYQSLIARTVKVHSLANIIADTLNVLPDETKEPNLAKFHEITGYFRTLSCLIACNAILYAEHNNDFPLIETLLPYIGIWSQQFEIQHFHHMQDNVALMNFYQFYGKFNATLQQAMVSKFESQHLSPSHLIKQVERKNALARLYGRSYHGTVIYSRDTTFCFLPDPKPFNILLQHITAMITEGVSKRQQFLLYFNTALGHVGLVDVDYNSHNNALHIINIDSIESRSQYHFLHALTKELPKLNVAWQIKACQAAIQRDHSSCGLYAFAFSGILSKTPVNSIFPMETAAQVEDQSELFEAYIEQPRFASCTSLALVELPPIDGVEWFALGALGDKAILIGQSFEDIQTSLAKRYPPEIASQIKQDFMLEHGLKAGSPEEKITYPQKLFERMQARQGLSIGVEAIRIRMKAADPGQALRRIAAKYGSIDDLTELTHALSTLSLDEPDPIPHKRFTPLLLAVSQKLPQQTAKLLRKGANPDVADASERTARSCYAALPEDSPIKQHSEIKRRLS